MKLKFTTPCFIRANNPELRAKLEELGYRMGFVFRPANKIDGILALQGEWRDLDIDFALTLIDNIPRVIDCGTNEPLFLALAALRNDTDKSQWFYNSYYNEWSICEQDSIFDYFNLDWCSHARKATPEELIKHFTKC